MRRCLSLILAMLLLPAAFAHHADIPYYRYDAENRAVYVDGTDVNYYRAHDYRPAALTPYYTAGYNQGRLYEREGWTREYEVRGDAYDSGYGYSRIRDNYRETESWERTIEYDYDRYGNVYRRYDPRYDGRLSRTLYRDDYDNYYWPNLYGTGRITIEDQYGPVHYNYRGQRYGHDGQGRRFYY